MATDTAGLIGSRKAFPDRDRDLRAKVLRGTPTVEARAAEPWVQALVELGALAEVVDRKILLACVGDLGRYIEKEGARRPSAKPLDQRTLKWKSATATPA